MAQHKEAIIIINKKTGLPTGIWDDDIPYAEMGKIQVERVSNIEYNNVKQCWEAKLTSTGDLIVDGEKEKNKVYEKEIDFVNKNIEDLAKKHFGDKS